MPKGKRTKAQMSQRVKQNQTVKINIKNLLPPTRQRGDYIQPRRGIPRDNLNMGNVSRLEAPSIRYAVRPPEFLPLPERINSQGQPQYFTAAPSRQGRPDLITQETNPSDIEPSKPSVRAVASQPVVKEIPRTPVQVYDDFEKQARATVNAPRLTASIPSPMRQAPAISLLSIDTPQMDESQNLVATAAGPSRRSMSQQTRRAMERIGSATATSVPRVPATGFAPRAPRVPPVPTPASASTSGESSLDFLDE